MHMQREISRRIEGVVVRVWDNDGEFLLIETAFGLPKWMQPASTEGRVFLYDGALHVVPLVSACCFLSFSTT